MQWVKAFVAGFLATLVFHQGLLALLHAAAVVPVSPYNWAPSAPLGVPAHELVFAPLVYSDNARDSVYGSFYP